MELNISHNFKLDANQSQNSATTTNEYEWIVVNIAKFKTIGSTFIEICFVDDRKCNFCKNYTHYHTKH